MSQRFFIPALPVGHINGKIANCRVKCPDTIDPEQENEGFFYGYRHAYNPDKSCFGIRVASRNLTVHPYTTEEQENRDLFTLALIEVNQHWQNLHERRLCLKDFDRQKQYNTPRGYAVAMCRYNGGEWLPQWSENTNP